MDERVVQRIMEDWRLTTWPIRPDAARVELFRSAMQGASSVLVMGATPELIDMLLTEGVDRVAAIELHPETMEAMRRLASEDWSRVELRRRGLARARGRPGSPPSIWCCATAG